MHSSWPLKLERRGRNANTATRPFCLSCVTIDTQRL